MNPCSHFGESTPSLGTCPCSSNCQCQQGLVGSSLGGGSCWKTNSSRHVQLSDFEVKSVQGYEALGAEIGRLVETKQAAYGDSFGKSGKVVEILYPNGIPPEKLGDALTIIRVIDKLFRISTDKDALGESPWRDVAGYAILSVKRDADRKAYLSQGGKEPTGSIGIGHTAPADSLLTKK